MTAAAACSPPTAAAVGTLPPFSRGTNNFIHKHILNLVDEYFSNSRDAPQEFAVLWLFYYKSFFVKVSSFADTQSTFGTGKQLLLCHSHRLSLATRDCQRVSVQQ